jgi:thiol-disulfide isomerase/thioredoxin
MKIQMLLLISLTAFFQFSSCDAQGNKDTKTNTSLQTEMVEVYYFHFTRRCETCIAVENESRKAVEELYSNALEEGRIIFQSLNLEEEGKQTADKLNIASQTLLVVRFGEKIDLTSQGFMYARTDPEKLKKALQDAIGKI